jgi:hypothetical protein
MAYKQWLPVALVLLMIGLSFWHAVFAVPGRLDEWSPAVLLPTVLANAAVIVLALWLMRIGLREDRGRPFAAGVIYFVTWAVVRYIDLFGGVGGMLGASLMFFVCGAGLFGVAIYWRRRKEVRDV